MRNVNVACILCFYYNAFLLHVSVLEDRLPSVLVRVEEAAADARRQCGIRLCTSVCADTSSHDNNSCSHMTDGWIVGMHSWCCVGYTEQGCKAKCIWWQ